MVRVLTVLLVVLGLCALLVTGCGRQEQAEPSAVPGTVMKQAESPSGEAMEQAKEATQQGQEQAGEEAQQAKEQTENLPQ